MSQCVSAKQHHSTHSGFQSAREVLKQSNFGFSISRQTRKRMEIIELIRTRREAANQNLDFASRPFVLCGLPVKRPPKGALFTRTSKRSVLATSNGPSAIWCSVGARSTGADLSYHIGGSPTEPENYVPQCGGDAGLVRHATGWITIPASDFGISKSFWGNDIFRNRYTAGKSDG